jgi:hypothetical protein
MAQHVKKAGVGASLARPWILPGQNPSPQGENTVIFLRKTRKTSFFGGRPRVAPTLEKIGFFDRLKNRPHYWGRFCSMSKKLV